MIKLFKKVFFVLTLLASFNALAQSPGISYQAVIINTQGIGSQGLPGENLDDDLYRNREVSLRFKVYNSLLQDEYVEEHSVITDDYGMVNVVIGWGNSTFKTFKDIEWDGKDKWLDVYISFAPPAYNVLELQKPLFALPVSAGITQEQYIGLSDSLLAHILVDQDTDLTNEIQNVSLDQDNLTLSNGGGVVDLSPYANTDSQNLTLNNTILSIDGGNSVDLSSLLAGTGTDDQTLMIDADSLRLEGGGAVHLDSLGSDDQNLTFDPLTNDLSIEGGNNVDLSSLLSGAGTDDQNLTFDPLTNGLGIEGGNTIDLSSLQDGTGSDDQTLMIDADSLRLEGGGAVHLDSLGSDDQNLTFDPLTNGLGIEGGNTIDLSSLQDGTGSDDQTLTIDADSLRLEGGGAVHLDSLGSDDQNLTFDPLTNGLGIEGGNTIDLSSLQDGTGSDDQTLTIDADSLRLEGGGAVHLDSLGSDDQILSISNDTIFLENGGFAKLPSGTVDTDDQFLSFSGDTLFLDNGGFVDLSSLAGSVSGADDQNLFIDNDSLRLEDGGAVHLDSLGSDDQNLAFDTITSVLSIEDGNSIDLSELNNLTINGALTYGGVTSFNTLTYTVQDSDNLIIQAGNYPLGTQILITLPEPSLNLGRVLTFSNAGANGGEIIQFVDSAGNSGIVIGATQSINAIVTVQLVCVGTAWMFSTGY